MTLMEEGEALFADGRVDEARGRFEAALAAGEARGQALNNLGVIAFSASDFETAADLFVQALAADPADRGALKNLCQVLAMIGQLHEAEAMLEAQILHYPDDAELKDLLLAARAAKPAPRPKLAVLCRPGLANFIGDLVARLSAQYEVRTVISDEWGALRDAIAWADTVWVEWANELAVRVTQAPGALAGKKLVVRLHSYEAFTPLVSQIDWARVDTLIFVAEHIQRIAEVQVPGLASRVRKIEVVPNGIDLHRFPLSRGGDGHQIAYLGSINYKKGPLLLLHAFAAIAAVDPKAKLHVGGEHQDLRFGLYFSQMIGRLGLTERIVLHGRVEDVPAFLADKDAILVTSVLEGHPVGVLEAMASGLSPLIHEFYGARGLYPAEFLWAGIPELLERWKAGRGDRAKWRRFVEQGFSVDAQAGRLAALFHPEEGRQPSLRAQIAAERAALEVEIQAAEKRGDAGRFLGLWYQHHYLPKAKYQSYTDWYASKAAARSIGAFARAHAVSPRPRSRPAEPRRRVLFVLETFDLDNPVLRHLYNTMAFADPKRFALTAVSRLSLDDVPARQDAYRSATEALRGAGVSVLSIDARDPMTRVNSIVDAARTHDAVVFHTGFQVSYFQFIAHTVRATSPEVRLVAYVWDFLEQGADAYSPYDRVLTVFEPNLEKIRERPAALVRYLYMDTDRLDAEAAIPADLARLRAGGVVLGTMVGQSRLRGHDPRFWSAVEKVLERVPSARFVAIGMSAPELELYLPKTLVETRTLGTGFTREVRGYLRGLDLYVDTFHSGGTSLWEAHDNGVPVFLMKTEVGDRLIFNFPTGLLAEPAKQTLDSNDDFGAWVDRVAGLAGDRAALRLLAANTRGGIGTVARVREEVDRVFELIDRP